MRPEFSQRVDSIPKSKIREFFDLVMGQSDIISLGVGEPDFQTPWTIREDAIFAIEKGHTTYTSNQGILELRQEISKSLEAAYGYRYQPENEILVTNGVSEGVDIVLRALLNPGDEVIVPDPIYVCYAPLICLANANLVTVETHDTDFIPDPKRIEAAITDKTKLIVLCYPNNPTGRIIPRDVLESIVKIAKKHNIWILSDEIYGELVYTDDFVSLPSISGTQAKVVLCKGFSKAYAMTGWRVGYICGPESLVGRALKIHQYSALCAPTISQLAAIDALKHAGNEMIKMRDAYKERRDITVETFQKLGFDIQTPEGAFYCFPNIQNTGLSGIEFANRLLEEEKVAVVPGIAFGQGTETLIRACYAVEPLKLIEALKRITRFVQNLKGT